ncbi:tyrosine-type recombinase/integrase [Corynebacterium neomassiliense]|uniref:tyrosine-type recombinase/integrase n=1 Tax=Corynebacterium neomassiliense TaxID=2079482 RepID=UPI00138720F9|nr:tyrosine-type recombinase/integrase [Corynebacterium neomassiliense]
MTRRDRNEWGEVQRRKTAKGWRYYPRYRLPGTDRRFTPGVAFMSRSAAVGWLNSEREYWESLVRTGNTDTWLPPKQRREAARAQQERDSLTVKQLCETWLTDGHFKASSESSTRDKFRYRVYDTPLAGERVTSVTTETIREWWRSVKAAHPDTATTNAQAYRKLHTAFQYAVDELGILEVNPVSIKGAGTAPRSAVRDRPLLTVGEVNTMVDSVLPRYRAPLSLMAWSGIRIGEMLALRRRDLVGLDGDGPVTVRVRRTAERVSEPVVDPVTGEQVVNPKTGRAKFTQRMVEFDTPKTAAANRDVVVSGPAADRLRAHAVEHMGPGEDALLCGKADGTIMLDTSFREAMHRGKVAAGREDVSPHDLRRFFGTMLVTNGVALEDARRLMGHERVEQLMEYQRAASGFGVAAASVLERLQG